MAIRQIIGACLALTLSISTTTAAEFIGVTAALKGEVLRLASTEPSASIGALSSGEKIFLGDDIQVGETGRLQVLLVDETVFTLGAGASMTIDKFVYDPNQTNELAANIKKGAFRFVSGKVAKAGKDTMKVSVPGATIAVRGTQVAGLIDDEGQSNIILLGPGPNSFGATPGAITVFNEFGSADILRGGYGLQTVPQEPPGEVQQADPTLLERLERAVSELASEEIAENIPEEYVTEQIVELAETLVEKGVTGTNVTNDVEVLRLISEDDAQTLADEGVNFDAGAAILLAKYAETSSLGSPPGGPTQAELQSSVFSGSRRFAATGVNMTTAFVSGGTGSGSFDVTTIYDFDADTISQTIAGTVADIKINSSTQADFDFAFSGVTTLANMATINGEPSFAAQTEFLQTGAATFDAGTDLTTATNPAAPVNNTFNSQPKFTISNLAITGTAVASDAINISTNGGLATINAPGDIGFSNISILTYNGATDYDNVGGTAVTAGQ